MTSSLDSKPSLPAQQNNTHRQVDTVQIAARLADITPAILVDANNVQRMLRHEQKYTTNHRIRGWESTENVWMDFRLCSKKDRAWESIQCWRAIYLYGICLKNIHRVSKVSYRTVQYFLHQPSRCGFKSAALIVLATKLLMARKIMQFEEPYELTIRRWQNTDPRKIPKNLLYTLKEPKGNTSRVV